MRLGLRILYSEKKSSWLTQFHATRRWNQATWSTQRNTFDLMITSSAMVVSVCHASAVGRPNQTVSSVLGPHMAIVAWTSALAAAFILCAAAEVALGAKRQPIPDDLRDVVDDEEDAEWRNWGASHSRGDGPPPDLSRMDPPALQAELLRGQTGPSFGFVKLRPGTPRCREDVVGIATRWSNVLRTGSVEAKFVAVDFAEGVYLEPARGVRV
ncbi:hypothetical protein PVAP13_9NG748300 [Panicum virgatum]|uniref:Uncharacterized protein n=1 Tax=Panicum virgatum TaxID=38727 RepID=A0A8T0N5T3_PANVG|nr:hypothetical protein PVAP13_9NG748300 [Panicum virgatum]